MQGISEAFSEHYAKKLEEHGPTAAGVDWVKEDSANQSYHYCSKLFRPEHIQKRITVLDVGWGYGGFLTYAKQLGLRLTILA